METTLLNVFKLVLAGCYGALISYRRFPALNIAGTGSHIMLSIGSCIILMASIHPLVMNVMGPPDRFAVYIAMAVGLLSGALIIGQRGSLASISTAASLWVAAVAGLAVGSGLYLEGGFVAIFSLVFLGEMMLDKQTVSDDRDGNENNASDEK